MSLTGQAKKDYRRSYMREYMRSKRAGDVKTSVKTQEEAVKTPANKTTGELPPTAFPPGKLPPIPGLIIEGNRIVGVAKPTAPTMAVQPDIPAEPPIYNPAVHKAGDRVRVFQSGRFVEMTVPEMDADGHAISDF